MDCYQDAPGHWFRFEKSDEFSGGNLAPLSTNGSKYLEQNGPFELVHEHKAENLLKLFYDVRGLRLTVADDLAAKFPPHLKEICKKWKIRINKQLDNLMQHGKREFLRNYCYELQPRHESYMFGI
jgi:hypothetical protein